MYKKKGIISKVTEVEVGEGKKRLQEIEITTVWSDEYGDVKEKEYFIKSFLDIDFKGMEGMQGEFKMRIVCKKTIANDLTKKEYKNTDLYLVSFEEKK